MNSSISDSFTFLPQGGIIQEFKIAGRNIVLNYPSAADYKTQDHPYFGETIGRVANRISNAKIKDLNGRSWKLEANNGPNALHGGSEGWGKKSFEGPTSIQRNGRETIMFRYISQDGEEGFPGTVELKLWYTPSVENVDDLRQSSLEIEYEVQLIGNEVEETVVSVTNHSYFNISDGPTIAGTEAILCTNIYQAKDDKDIPTGKIEASRIIKANEPFHLGEYDPAFDHCFVMDTDPASIPLDTRQKPLKKLGHFYHPNTKIHLEALSTEPAFQFYTGDFVNVPAVGEVAARGPRSGMCIEASRYVNAINEDEWRHMVTLKAGQTWVSKVYE